MDSRQETILRHIVEDYIESAAPIGSVFLARKYDMGVSPATIRNEMAELTNEGYLQQPYTSAGRIPTARAYKLFVDMFLEEAMFALDGEIERRIRQALIRSTLEVRRIGRVLADSSKNVVLSGSLSKEEFYIDGLRYLLQQPEFMEQSGDMFRMLGMLEEMNDEFIGRLRNIFERATEDIDVFIGRENPFMKDVECSVIISSLSLPSSQDTVVAIVGPLRMHYRENISLLENLRKLSKAIYD